MILDSCNSHLKKIIQVWYCWNYSEFKLYNVVLYEDIVLFLIYWQTSRKQTIYHQISNYRLLWLSGYTSGLGDKNLFSWWLSIKIFQENIYLQYNMEDEIMYMCFQTGKRLKHRREEKSCYWKNWSS